MRAIKGLGFSLIVIALLYGLFFAVQILRPRTLALKLPDTLQPGDVVLMRSHTWRAELVRLIDGVPYSDGFSHVGLVHSKNDNGTWDIVHAVPGKGGTVRKEAWPSIARGGGISEAIIFRADIGSQKRAVLIQLQTEAAARAIPFDGGFDHHDHTSYYCTELVTALYAKARHPVVSKTVMNKRAIFPGHLAGSEFLKPIGTTRDVPR